MRRWMNVLLIASLSLNLMLIGGFLYQRLVIQPRLQTEWAAKALKLDDRQRSELQQLIAWRKTRLRQALDEMHLETTTIKHALRDARSDDPVLKMAMQRLNGKRQELQMETLEKVFSFRDNLSSDQRQLFNQMSERPGFVLNLIGASPRNN